MPFSFYKWQAFGNDFILIESLPSLDLVSNIKDLCHRKYGIGADGVIFLDLNKDIPQMHFYNADGTQTLMCGNGLRSTLIHLIQKNKEPKVYFGNKLYSAFSEKERLFVNMPYPQPLFLKDPIHKGIWVDAGVPHFLIEVSDVHKARLDNSYFALRYHPSFGKEGTNITFYEKKGAQVFLRTFERGVEEETYACGSAAIACSFLSDDEELEMIYKTGQKAFVKKNKQQVSLSGEASCVFQGLFF